MRKGCPLLEIAYTSLFSFTRPTKKNYFINETKKKLRTTGLPVKFRLTQINPKIVIFSQAQGLRSQT
jgi:hypothetical protein